VKAKVEEEYETYESRSRSRSKTLAEEIQR